MHVPLPTPDDTPGRERRSLDGTWALRLFDHPDRVSGSALTGATEGRAWKRVAVPGNWTVQDTGDPAIVYVTAEQVVQNQLTGVMWGFGLLHGGRVANMSGYLAPLVQLGDYDTVSATDAVSPVAGTDEIAS